MISFLLSFLFFLFVQFGICFGDLQQMDNNELQELCEIVDADPDDG